MTKSNISATLFNMKCKEVNLNLKFELTELQCNSQLNTFSTRLNWNFTNLYKELNSPLWFFMLRKLWTCLDPHICVNKFSQRWSFKKKIDETDWGWASWITSEDPFFQIWTEVWTPSGPTVPVLLTTHSSNWQVTVKRLAI